MQTVKGALACFLMAHIFVTGSAMGQDLPHLKSVQIKSGAKLVGEIYSYSYTIVNHTENIGDIYGIDIDISEPENGVVVSGEGLANGSGFLKNTTALALKETEAAIIPVGLSAPPGWIVGIGIDGAVKWGGSDEVPFMPGQSLGGFLITSRGLPGIRSFRAEPFVDMDALPDEVLPPGDIQAAKQLSDEIAVFGKTVGPTSPPADFVALDFLNHIEDLKHQAFELGWITNKGVEKSLGAKLDQARERLQSGHTKAAANVLNAFLNEVSAQGCESYDVCAPGKHLKPEAWALLKFSAEYLLKKL